MKDYTKPWLLWVYDPCPEGGWHITADFDTEADAVVAAKARHERERDIWKEMVKDDPYYSKEMLKDRVGWSCYAASMVTPNKVFEIRVDNKEAL